MKKYLKLLPLILYPYAYVIFLIFMFFLGDVLEELLGEGVSGYIYMGIFVLYNVYVLFIAVFNSVITAKGHYSAYEAAKMNLAVKGWQIPAYMFHFLLGIMGLLMSVWGIGFIFFAIAIDVVTIALTGISSIGCAVKMRKEGVLPTAAAVITAICSFIFCIDVIVGIIYVVLAKKHRKFSNGK